MTQGAPPPPVAPGPDGGSSQRLDKWLWHVRFFKTRSLAAKLVAAGKVRVNAERVSKPARQISPGDTLTFPQGRAIRVIRVVSLPERRGPASEAQAAYTDLSPPEGTPADGAPSAGGPRPTKKDRRNLPRF